MNQLETVTFFNSQRFPYAKLDLSGNTIVVGPNGVGKTSSLRAPLFFYGVSDKAALGIRSDSKLSFGSYFLQDMNSYIFYTYTNEHGHVLLMVYRPADKIRYRFAMLDSDVELKEIVADENNEAYSPDDIIGEFVKNGIHFSDPVMTGDYREILYGTDKAKSGYKRYALFKGSKDFAQLPATLSSIFVNSTVKSSSVQSALAGCIEGASPLGLQQFRRQIGKAIDWHRRIRAFESNDKEIATIESALKRYNSSAAAAATTARQIYSNAAFFEQRANECEVRLGQIAAEMEERNTHFEVENRELTEKISGLGEEIKEIDILLKTAEERMLEHKEAGIDRMLHDHNRLEEYRLVHKAANDRYEELVGDNKDIAAKFDGAIDAEAEALKKTIDEIEKRRNNIISDYNTAIAKASDERERAMGELEATRKDGRKELEHLEAEAKLELNKIAKAVTVAEHSDPDREQREILSNKIASCRLANQEAQSRSDEARRLEEKLKEEIEDLATQRARLVTQQDKFLSVKLTQPNREIRDLHALLEIEDDTLLSQIREFGHPRESEIAALLKDKVLLSTDLSPSYDAADAPDTFYGITIDAGALDLSRYDQRAIRSQIKLLEEEKERITKDAQRETDKLAGEIAASAKEKGKRAKEKDAEAVNEQQKAQEAEIAMLQAKTEYDELVDTGAYRRESAIREARKKEATAKASLDKAQENLSSYDKETDSLKEGIRTAYKSSRDNAESTKKESLSGNEAEQDATKAASAKRSEELLEKKAKALEEGGVDRATLEEAENEMKDAQRDLERVKGYAGKIAVYNNDKEKFFDKVPNKKTRLAAAKDERDSLEQKRAKREEKHDAGLTILKEEAGTVGEAARAIENDFELYRDFKKESIFGKYAFAAAQTADVQATDRKLILLANDLRKHDTEVDRSLNEIKISLNRIFGVIGDADELFGLVRPEGNDTSYIAAARQLAGFIDNGQLDGVKQQVATQFSMVHRHLSTTSAEFISNSDDVRRMVTKMNKSLRDLEGIKVVDSVQVKWAKSDNPTLSLLERIKDIDIGAGFEATLFNPEPDVPATTSKLLNILEEVSETIDKERRESLELSESFSLKFRVVENGNDSGWITSLDDIGSNGTDVLVKTMIYVAMLDMVMASAQRSKSDSRIHVVLDEVGVLDQGYLRELIEFANARNVFFFNGAPDPKIPGKYNANYTIKRENSTTSSVKPTARKL